MQFFGLRPYHVSGLGLRVPSDFWKPIHDWVSRIGSRDTTKAQQCRPVRRGRCSECALMGRFSLIWVSGLEFRVNPKPKALKRPNPNDDS